jgi:sialidase-like protein/BNR repeat protein
LTRKIVGAFDRPIFNRRQVTNLPYNQIAMRNRLLLFCLLPALLCAQPGTPAEPVRVLDGVIDMAAHDGRLRPAIGVENIEVMRANRTHPETADNYGWTYNHAPMLAYWNGKFYLEYLSNPFGEHVAPGQTLVVTSADGRTWDMPKQVFPIYPLKEAGMAMMHQRMGFYVAPNGRLLVLAFYGQAPNPFGEGGIGRVVREAYRDGSYGPIYFIRYNTHAGWNEGNTSLPFYTKSTDQGFVEACHALLADKLKTMQWWEEQRNNDDGFYTVTGLQAPSVFHRKDGMAVVLWKASWSALSSDEGKIWSKPVKVPTIITDGAKVWGQRTSDGRYAIVYNPANDGTHRWPLAMATSDDGIVFDHMLAIHGEVAPRRYIGHAKDFGSQYIRGISEGNGNPPGTDLWLTYSGNKEDIWDSRVPVPVRYTAEGPVSDNFDKLEVGGRIPDWNIYRPQWAPVRVVAFPSAANKSLLLEDKDPYDYAQAVRVFAESKQAKISFRVFPHSPANGRLEVEVLDAAGHRPVRVVIAQKPGAWHSVKIAVNAEAGTYDLSIDGRAVSKQAAFAEPAGTVERLLFRTGEFRTSPTRQSDRYAGADLPNAGEPAPLAAFNIDDVIVK